MAHWHIAGVGAIGCLWAHKLTQAGHKVSLILKDSLQLAQYNKAGGIGLSSPNKQSHFIACQAYLAEHIERPIEHLLVCCKSWQSLSIINTLSHTLTSNSKVVLLQNGLAQLYEAKPLLEHCHYYCASTTDGVFKTDNFNINLAGAGATVVGPFNAAATSQSIELGTAEWQENIEALLWQKLCVNAVINPLTAIYDVRNGEVLSTPECAERIGPLCEEISTISSHAGHSLASQELQKIVYAVATQTANNSSSMRADIHAGRRTEIQEINGYLSGVAKQNGLASPLNDSLIAAIIQKLL